MKLQISLNPATLSTYSDNPLVRSVIISLFSWRRANDDDDVQQDDRQGWWGDSYADEDGDLTGSRLWELMRQKVTSETLEKAKEYAEEALQWLIDDRVAQSINATAESNETGRVDMQVVVVKPGAETISIRFQDVWGML